jgi:hypothetical protein
VSFNSAEKSMLHYAVASLFQTPNSGMLRERKIDEPSRWYATRLGRLVDRTGKVPVLRKRFACHAGAILPSGCDA